MRFLKSFLLIAAIASLSFTTINKNGLQAWRFIGDKNVRFALDHDVILVTGNDSYRQLKLRVTDAPLKINDMRVHFENDEVLGVNIRSEIRKGGESRVIDLPGGSRRIKKIEFWYSTIGVSKGTARVAVWGKR